MPCVRFQRVVWSIPSTQARRLFEQGAKEQQSSRKLRTVFLVWFIAKYFSISEDLPDVLWDQTQLFQFLVEVEDNLATVISRKSAFAGKPQFHRQHSVDERFFLC